MKTRISLAIILGGLLFAQSFAQQPASQDEKAKEKPAAVAADKQNAPQKEEVVKISVTLVQVDAVVTDGKGHLVTDLKPEDFEIYEDGRRQRISNFSFISTQPAPTPPKPAPAPNKSAKNAPPVPPVTLRPEQVRRTIALVVDDLGLSFESTAGLRDALKKFVNEQMQPGDLVAIIRTGAGIGALQQFTTDKRMLYAAIERVRWNPMGRGGVSAFAPIEAQPLSAQRNRQSLGRNNDVSLSGNQPSPDESLDRFREDLFAVGTLGALNYVVRGLRDLSGRKSVVLFSDGFRLFSPNGDNQRVLDALRRLTDLANRASVVIYTIDTRGLQPLTFTAADNLSGRSQQDIQQEFDNRRAQFFDSQEGLNYLAAETGGLFIRNNNDLNRGIRRALDDQQGYYLIGYTPDASTFRRTERGLRKFHKVNVKVKRAGLNVRSRTGFFGVPDEEAHPTSRTPAQQIMAALTSPFGSGDVHLKLTSLFGHDPKAGAFMRSLLHIDPRDLTFTEEGGVHKAVVDIAAFTFSDNGLVVDREGRSYTLQAPDDVYQKLLQRGILYTLVVPIKKPGAYQLRVAVRDATSERVGAANQFIEVPDIGKKRLALSGVVVTGSDPANQNKAGASAASQASSTTEGAADEVDPSTGPSLRKLHRRMLLDYGFMIYNAQLNETTHHPQLEAQVILLHEGKPVYTGKVNPVNVSDNGQVDWRHIAAGGRLQLGSDMELGDYVLQVIVTDKLAKEKYSTATQWIDFEIVQ